jgi:hypothetical protein
VGSIIHESEEINNIILTNNSINRVWMPVDDQVWKQLYYIIWTQVWNPGLKQMWSLFFNLSKHELSIPVESSISSQVHNGYRFCT